MVDGSLVLGLDSHLIYMCRRLYTVKYSDLRREKKKRRKRI